MNLRNSGIIVLAIAMLFLAGCGGGGGGETGPTVTNKAFQGGSEGLAIEFMSNAPPPTVFDTKDSTFDISLRLQNLGEDTVDAKEAVIKIIGIDPKQFALTDSEKNPSSQLLGVRIDPQGNVIPGSITTVDFYGLHWNDNPLTGSVPYQITASLCYKYESKAIAKLCLKDNLLSTPRDSDMCKVTRTIQPEVSGAPVRIESFSQSAIGQDKLTFSFVVKHVGTGEIFVEDSDHAAGVCDDSSFANENKIKVTIAKPGIGTLSCPGLDSTGNYVKLFDGKGIVSCNIDKIDVSTNMERALDISLEYNYREIKSQPIMVRHIENN